MRIFIALIVSALVGGACVRPGEARRQGRRQAAREVDRREGVRGEADRRVHAALLGRGDREAVDGDLAVRHGDPLPGVAAGGCRVEPHRPRSRPAGRLGARRLRADRAEGADDAVELPVSGDHRRDRRAAGRRAVVREVGALGIQGGSRRGRPPPRGRNGLLPPRRARRRGQAAAGQAGPLQAGRQPVGALPAAHEGFPEEHRGGGDAHLHDRRGPRPAAARGDARARGGHGSRAPLVRRAARARRQLRAAPVRPAGQLVRPRVQRLRLADLLADREAVDREAPASKEGPRRPLSRSR